MKTYIKYILVALLAIASVSCADSKIGEYKEVKLRISMSVNGYEGALDKPVTLKLTNHSGVVNSIQEYKVSQLGEVVLENLIPGQYSISVAGNLSEDEALEIMGTKAEMMIKGGVTGINIFDYTENETIEIDLNISTTSSLIFKEIYYNGTKYTNTSTGKLVNYFYEQFYEIYNNSDEVVYLDSLCISNLYPNAGVPLKFKDNLDEDNLFGQAVWMIPGSGRDKPLAPGKSIVITLSGRNHKEVATELLDLSSADYECYVEKAGGKAPLDYPVANMIPAYYPSTVAQWLTTVRGAAMVIYKLDYEFNKTDVHRPIGAAENSTPYVRIPKSAILDAVECLYDHSKAKEKRISSTLDAGYMTVSEDYGGRSIARKKLQTTADGRIIFQDTNNSTEDFEIMDKPQIHRYLNN